MLANAEDEELASACKSFDVFFLLLCSYFLAVPLRDEAALSIGIGVFLKRKRK